MTRIEAALDRLHARVVANGWLRWFTAMTRGLLALGFIHAGLRKTGGEPFAPGIPVDTPIGYYFDAFWQTGEYYRFVGAAQVLAGVLLLFPATATVGAVIYFPIILNIFVLTYALEFGGTTVVTSLMLLACTYLLCWDYDRWKALLPGFSAPRSVDASRHLGFVATLLAGTTAIMGPFGAGGAGLALLEGRSPAFSLTVLALTTVPAGALVLIHRRMRARAAGLEVRSREVG
ncbi:MAG TPA: hypothetical protein VF188_08480 [Longimicrobiales bacterium]